MRVAGRAITDAMARMTIAEMDAVLSASLVRTILDYRLSAIGYYSAALWLKPMD
jgi:hypothetical protein